MEPQDLKAWRDRNDLTQQVAADALGISRRTFVAYEQGESDIPRVVEYACNWLDRNPAAIEPRDRFRIALTEGGTAGTREVALASLALIQSTLARLKTGGVLSSEMLLDICNAAIDIHNQSATGDQPWTKPVINLIRDIFYDLEPRKRSKLTAAEYREIAAEQPPDVAAAMLERAEALEAAEEAGGRSVARRRGQAPG